MIKTYIKVLAMVLTSIVMGVSTVEAQDFNPSNPPEPNTLYRLIVDASPADVARTTGTGRYVQGTRVNLNTSSIDTDYTFIRWEKDGETISTSRSFYYTVKDVDETITAIYDYKTFDPVSPSDPGEVYRWRLYLNAEPEEGCSFNLDNGSRHANGESFVIRAYPNMGFVFDGWYDDKGDLISDSLSMTYTMPGSNETLTARFTFMPDSPDEPKGDNQGIEEDIYTGVEDVSICGNEVFYYDLRGLEVNGPHHGVVIRLKGNEVVKILK